MFFATLKQIFDRSLITLINQLSVLIAIPVLANRLEFIIFGQVAITFALVQFSWVLCEWGIQNYSIETWGKLNTRTKINNFTSQAIYLIILLSITYIVIVWISINLGFLDLPKILFFSAIPSILMGNILPLWFFQNIKKIN